MTNLVDLTFTISEGMTTFPVPWHPCVEITQLGRLHVEKRETRKIVLGTHTGTHMDAPRHFVPGGCTVDKLAIDLFVGPALLIDFSHLAPGSAVSRDLMSTALKGRKPERLMLRFDWSDRINADDYYVAHPYMTDDCAELLVELGVRLVAMDTPMPDDPRNGRGTPNDSPIHKILLGNGIVLVEYVTNLKALGPIEMIELFVLPLKIEAGDGAPVRCLARPRIV